MSRTYLLAIKRYLISGKVSLPSFNFCRNSLSIVSWTHDLQTFSSTSATPFQRYTFFKNETILAKVVPYWLEPIAVSEP